MKINDTGIIKLTFITLVLFLFSCDTNKPAETKLNDLHFDKKIINDLRRYEALSKFLLKYSDTIVKYRNASSYTVEVSRDKIDTVLSSMDCYAFHPMFNNCQITDVPAFLKEELNNLYCSIGSGKIKQFVLCQNKKICIIVKTDNMADDADITHSLLLNYGVGQDTHYQGKDTLLTSGFIYRLDLVPAQKGW